MSYGRTCNLHQRRQQGRRQLCDDTGGKWRKSHTSTAIHTQFWYEWALNRSNVIRHDPRRGQSATSSAMTHLF